MCHLRRIYVCPCVCRTVCIRRHTTTRKRDLQRHAKETYNDTQKRPMWHAKETYVYTTTRTHCHILMHVARLMLHMCVSITYVCVDTLQAPIVPQRPHTCHIYLIFTCVLLCVLHRVHTTPTRCCLFINIHVCVYIYPCPHLCLPTAALHTTTKAYHICDMTA